MIGIAPGPSVIYVYCFGKSLRTAVRIFNLSLVGVLSSLWLCKSYDHPSRMIYITICCRCQLPWDFPAVFPCLGILFERAFVYVCGAFRWCPDSCLSDGPYIWKSYLCGLLKIAMVVVCSGVGGLFRDNGDAFGRYFIGVVY